MKLNEDEALAIRNAAADDAAAWDKYQANCTPANEYRYKAAEARMDRVLESLSEQGRFD